MDNQTVFVVTLKGIGEIKNHTRLLPEDVKRALVLVDDKSTVEILARRAASGLRPVLGDMLQRLESGGFIQDKANLGAGNMLRVVTPKISAPTTNAGESDDLDFTSGLSPTLPATKAMEQANAEVARLKDAQETAVIQMQLVATRTKAEAEARAFAKAEANAKQQAEMVSLKAEQAAAQAHAKEAEIVRIKAEQEVEKARAELAAARLEAERSRAELETAKVEAEASAKREVEAVRLREQEAVAKAYTDAEARAKQEAEMIRLKAEQATAQMRAEAEALRIKAEQEAATARAELEAARLEAEQVRAELEAAKAEAEALAKWEAEAARLREQEAAAKAHAAAEARAKQEAEMTSLKAGQEAAQVRAEAEALRIKAELAAANTGAELEAARLEAERVRAEWDAAKVAAEVLARQEAEAARLREQEAAAKAEVKAQQQTEMVRLQAEQEAVQVRAEAEAVRVKAEQEMAKTRLELEAARLEIERSRVELEAAKVAAEALAKQEAEAARLREQEAVAKAHTEAETRAKLESDTVRLNAEQIAAQVRAEAEALRTQAELDAATARGELEAARQEAERVRAELDAARAEAEALAKREAEAARLREQEADAKARAEAEVARIKAEHEAARIKTEDEAKLQQEREFARRKAEEEINQAKAVAEAARLLKAEQEAARMKMELEIVQAKAKAEAQARVEASARAEAAARAQQEVDVTKLRAEQAAAIARADTEAKAKREAEETRFRAAQEISRIKLEAEEQLRQSAQAQTNTASALAAKSKADAAATRSMIATVLFFDIVGYTKQPVSKQIELKTQFNKLVSEFIKDIKENQRIILDTGDGAAIGFLQHPEDAIEVALKFRHAVTASAHQNYPELMVRMGIHLGPVNIVKDMNGQGNMVGDGINDAQRIMSFASSDHIYISRAYHDVVSRLSAEYAKLFQYGGVKNDKHGRQHQVYEVVDEQAKIIARTEGARPSGEHESAPFSINLEPFILSGSEQAAARQLPHPASKEISSGGKPAAAVQEPTQAAPAAEVSPEKFAQEMLQEIGAGVQTLVQQKVLLQADAARIRAEQEAASLKAEKDARQMAEEQAKAWADAEQRAKQQAAIQAKAEFEAQQPVKSLPAKVSANARRKPLPLGKIVAGLFALLLAFMVALPYVWPMQNAIAQLEKKLSAQLQQPVHIARMKASLLPLPKLELQEVSVGSAQELKAANVVLNFDVASLFADMMTINNTEINDLALNAGSFGQALSWMQTASGDTHYRMARMVLKRMRVNGEGLSLPPVNGYADWDAQGHFSKALLRSDDGKLDVEWQAPQQIALRIKESSLPWLPGILFNELDAKGEASENAINFTELDGQLFGGRLTGSAHLSWLQGWQMQGRLNLRAIELHQALPQFGIEGEMKGDTNFVLNGATLPQLASAPRLDGAFVVEKGVISKMNILETAANHQGATGGRTHFEELSGTLQLENNSQHLRQLRLATGASGPMTANGSVDVSPGGQLSGQLSVDLKLRAGSRSLALSGTLTEPVLRPAR